MFENLNYSVLESSGIPCSLQLQITMNIFRVKREVDAISFQHARDNISSCGSTG